MKEFTAFIRLYGRPSITLGPRKDLSGEDGILRAIAWAITDEAFDPKRVTEIDIFHQEEEE